MRTNKAIKIAACIGITAMFISIQQTNARADKIIYAEQGVAGISTLLENATPDILKDAYASIESLNTKVKSPYENLGVSIADNYVNVRKDPTTNSDVVGKLYRGCAADILERLEGDWVKIKSGDVEGYIASNFLAIGEEAESMVDKYATKWATVTTTTLNVRFDPNTDARIKEQIPLGETYVVVKEYDEWAEILLGADDQGEDYTGFVHKDFIDIKVEFKVAISIEEENRIIREQQEAERAENERKQKLIQEEAERKERERKEQERREAEAQAKAEESAKEEKQESSSSSGSSSSGSSSSVSGLQQEIVNYALKFVGNPYVWGGESLTKGADCSGFVQSIYADFGITIKRTSREQAVTAGRKVSASDLQPGDLIFYANSSGTVNHVAMYIGNGRIVHAANRRQGIITSKYNYREIKAVRRVVN